MRRVLCLEPDRILAEQLQESLSSRGYVTDVCADAQQAISAADLHKPDIVVMEVVLAAHSGIEYLYEFRSYVEWRRIPVLLLSRLPADAIGLTAETLDDLAISEVLYKPDVSLEKLFIKIEKHLEKSTA